ncbi:MAG: hypothetical protein AAGB34_11365, partial [Planctomycetota bacterium]
MMRRFPLACVAGVTLLFGCTTPEPRGSDQAIRWGAGPISNVIDYDALAAAHNDRISRLDRVWSRAAVRVNWRDREGKDQSEKGEGHFQWLSPGYALSIGKLGETLIWIGFDDERYWMLDRHESKEAYFGRLDQIDRVKAGALGLPAMPREMVVLMGLAPLPVGMADPPDVIASGDGTHLGFELSGKELWRYTFDAVSLDLVEVALVKVDGEDLVVSDLQDYSEVDLERGRGLDPRLATRFVLRHAPSGAELVLDLNGKM